LLAPRDEAAAILKLIDQDKSSKVEHLIGEHHEQILLYASSELIRLPATTTAAEVWSAKIPAGWPEMVRRLGYGMIGRC
jgi:hypothetical protein